MLCALTLLFGLALPAHATSYTVSQLLPFGNDLSHVHTTEGKYQNGTAVTRRVADIKSATGSYTVDAHGAGSLSLQLTTVEDEIFSLSGDNFNFGHISRYDPNPLAHHVLLNTVHATMTLPDGGLSPSNSGYAGAPGGQYNVKFLAKLMHGTNTLVPGENGDPTLILTLWGAGKHDSIGQRRAGLDIKVAFTPTVVPVPAAIWLFGTALLGLMSFRRNRLRLA